MIFAAMFFKPSIKGFLRTATPILVDTAGVAIVTTALAVEVSSLLRKK